MKKFVNIGIVILFQLACAYGQDDPKEIIKANDTELRGAITAYTKQPSKTGRENLEKLTFGLFDFQLLSKNVIPKPVWDTCSLNERNAFVKAFKNMIESSAMSKIEMYRTDSTLYDNAIVSGENATVKAHLWKNGRENMIVYKMTKVNLEWKVYDLVINDLSTARSYKEQFATMFKTKKMEDVITLLESKKESGEAKK